MTLVNKGFPEDRPSLMPKNARRRNLRGAVGLALPPQETACSLRPREGIQTPLEPRTCLYSVIETGLQSASLPKPIRTIAPP